MMEQLGEQDNRENALAYATGNKFGITQRPRDDYKYRIQAEEMCAGDDRAHDYSEDSLGPVTSDMR